jgi:glutamine---fructose-6-phosphate transaminase (isomerizing)
MNGKWSWKKGQKMGLIEDINNEPEVLRESIKAYETHLKDRLKDCEKLLAGKEIFFTGMGTSYCISLAGSYFMSEKKLRATACESGELYYYQEDCLPDNAAIVVISQSGESAEPKLVAKKMFKKIPVIAITNNENSTIAKNADLVLPMLAGKESLMSTKTYINGLMCTWLISEIAKNGSNGINKKEIGAIPEKVEITLKNSFENINRLIEALGYFRTLIVLGRGPVLSNVHDAAMILKESTSISAEGISGAYFRHGPVELTGPGCSVIIFAPSGKTFDLMINTAYEASKVKSMVLVLSDRKIEENDNLKVFNLPSVDEIFALFLYILPIQVMATKMAVMSGKVRNSEIGITYRVGKTIEKETN